MLMLISSMTSVIKEIWAWESSFSAGGDTALRRTAWRPIHGASDRSTGKT
jgi:hypothetical protein